MAGELVADQSFLRLSSQMSVMIFNIRLFEWTAFFIVSKLDYSNLNSDFDLLKLLSGDINLKPGPNDKHKFIYFYSFILSLKLACI